MNAHVHRHTDAHTHTTYVCHCGGHEEGLEDGGHAGQQGAHIVLVAKREQQVRLVHNQRVDVGQRNVLYFRARVMVLVASVTYCKGTKCPLEMS